MNRLRLPVVFSLLTVLWFCASCGKITAIRQTSAETGKAAAVTDVSGKVTVKKTNENKVYDAFAGMLLTQGDRLETGADSFVALELDEGKELIISENTCITISELKDLNNTEKTWLQMETGAVWANIKEKLNPDSGFEIETPTAVMGVRGTKFSVLHRDDMSTLTVIEGLVEAAVNVESIDPDGKKTVKKIAGMVGPLQQLQIDAGVAAEADLVVKPLTPENLDPFTRDIVRNLLETQPESIGEEIRDQLDTIINEHSGAIGKGTDSPAGNGGIQGFNLTGLPGLDFSGIFSGDLDLNSNMALPEGFPRNAVPVLPDGNIIHATKEGNQYLIAVRSNMSLDETQRFYRDHLKDADGFTEMEVSNVYVLFCEKGGYLVQITLWHDKIEETELSFAVIVVTE
ncbi:MAG: FecR domain-containing protein [Bacillota bacterium]